MKKSYYMVHGETAVDINLNDYTLFTDEGNLSPRSVTSITDGNGNVYIVADSGVPGGTTFCQTCTDHYGRRGDDAEDFEEDGATYHFGRGECVWDVIERWEDGIEGLIGYIILKEEQ